MLTASRTLWQAVAAFKELQLMSACWNALQHVERSVGCVQALKDANLKLSDINEVILVGGSTRIVAVQVVAWCR